MTRRWPLIALLVVVVLATALWLARRPLTSRVLTDYLAASGVSASYRISQLGARRLVLDDARFGPAAAPDLAARRIIVDYRLFALTPRVAAIRLEDPVLRVRVSSAGVSFGSLDRLIPPGRTEALPDIAVAVTGGQARVTTPAGPLRAAFAGQGALPDGWRGTASIAPARLALNGCAAALGEIRLSLATRRNNYDLAATGRGTGLACAGGRVAALDFTARALAPVSLARASGEIGATLAAPAFAETSAASATARVAFAGTFEALAGNWTAAARGLAAPAGRVAAVRGTGRFTARPGDRALTAGGDVKFTGVAATAIARAAPPDLPGVLGALGARARIAAARFDAVAPFSLDIAAGAPSLAVPSLAATGRGGATLTFDGGGIRYDRGALTASGDARLTGGGLPAATLRLDSFTARPGALAATGMLTHGGWRGGGGALGPGRIRFASANGTVTTSGRVLLSGPLGPLAADRLDLPLDLRLGPGGIAWTGGCTAIGWQSLVADGARLDAARLRACSKAALINGSLAATLDFAPLALSGSYGGAPVRLATRTPARLTVTGTSGSPRLTLAPLTLTAAARGYTLGARVEAALMLGPKGWTGGGRFDRAALTGAPARVTEASARWTVAGNRLALTGGTVTLADPAARPRVQPLRLTGLAAVRAGDVLTASGKVALAATGASLGEFTARHGLAAAAGSLDFIAAPAFNPKLQPFQISERARGVVENVVGTVRAEGRIDWRGDALTASRATLRLDGLSLATAAAGPVTGLVGTITFTDLLAPATPPGQVLRIGSLNPGVLVENGIATFRLPGDGAVEIASVVWPFAGGTLTIEPVTLHPEAPANAFSLTVTNLDAEAFLARFDIPDLRVTGRFDGVLPLVFDAGGGRIQGGRLAAKTGGGQIQYVGEAGQRMTGAAALAFDALRGLRYDSLNLTFDGDLDGELVTGLVFSGRNEAPVRAAGPLPITAEGLPFRFTVSVRAPSRGLLGTAASFGDVRDTIRKGLPPPQVP